MMVEGPISRGYGFVQQECWLPQRHTALSCVMEGLRSFPVIQNQGYYGDAEENVQGWKTTQGCNTHVAPVSSNPTRYINLNHLSSAPANNVSWESKTASPNERKQKVTAFGPNQAEHARRLYQSRGNNPDFQPGLAHQNRPYFNPMLVSNYRQCGVKKQHYLPRDSSLSRPRNRATTCFGIAKRKVYVPIKSQPQETVLKVARISPRPDMMQSKILKKSFSFGGKLPTKKERMVRKSNIGHDMKPEMDLETGPLFQILCEISET